MSIKCPISKFFKSSDLSKFNIDKDLADVIKAKELDTLDSLTDVNKKLVEYAQKTDAAKISAQGFYKTQIDMSGSITGTFKTIQQYNNLVSKKRDTVAFTDAVSELNKDLGGTLKGLNGAKAGAGTYTKALGAATAQTALLTAWSIALNAALTFGISLVINVIVAGIEKLINKSKEAREEIENSISKLQENTEAYKDEKEAIDSLVNSYTKIALSSKDLTSSKEELSSIQDQLIEKLGEEAKGLELVNKSYAENIELVQKARYEKAKEFVDEDKTDYENAKNELRAPDIIEITAKGRGTWRKYKDIIAKYNNTGYKEGNGIWNAFNTMQISGTLYEQADTLDRLWKDLDASIDKTNENEMAWLTEINKKREEIKKQIERDESLISEFESEKDLVDNAVLEGELTNYDKEEIEKATQRAQQILESSDSAEIYTFVNDIKKIKEELLRAAGDDELTKSTIETAFGNIESMIAEKTAGINSLLDGYVLNLQKFKDETYSKVSEKLTKLDSARSSLLQGESISASDVKELIDLDASLADKFTKTADGYTIALSDIKTARNKFTQSTEESIRKEIAANEKWIRNKEGELKQLQEDYSVTSTSDIKSPSDAAEYNIYTKAVEKLNNDILTAEENTANWKALLDILFSQPANIDTQSPAEKIKEYSETLKEYEKGGNALLRRQGYDVKTFTNSMGDIAANFSNVVFDEKGNFVKTLSRKQLKEYAEKVLNGGEDYLKLQVGFEFTGEGAEESAKKVAEDVIKTVNKFWETASKSFDYESFSNEADAVKSDMQSIQEVIDLIDEGTLNDEAWGLTEAHPELLEVIDDSEKLRAKLVELRDSAPNDLVKVLENIRSTLTDKSQITAIDNLIARLQKLPESVAGYNEIIIKLKNQIKLYDDKIAAIEKEKDKQNEILDALNEQKEALEKIISNYESAANAVTNAIDREIDALEDEKKLIEDRYNTEIDALRAENEERDRANDLREKELALEKAKNNMVRVYDKERGGFIIQANSEEIAKAQKEYDDAVNDDRIAELEAQRDAEVALIDEKIEAYEEYKEAWQDAIDAYKNAQDEINAAAILGYGWRDAVMAKDTSLINSFALNYAGFQNQLHNIIEPQIEDVQNIIKQYDNEIDKYQELKKEQEEYLSFYEEYSVRFANATAKQTEAINAFSDALSKLLGGKGSAKIVSELFQVATKSIRGYSKGGIVDYTGTAVLHGTPSKPEMVLNNQQISTLWKLLSTGQTEQMNRFMNSAPSIFSGRSEYQNSFDGTPKFADRNTMDRIASQQYGNTDNSTTFVITGNDIRAKDYDEFKGYMDRYIREANMNRLVGKR